MTDPVSSGNPDPERSRLIIGCGYLGRRVAAQWIGQGQCVFATTRARADELRELGIVPITADVLKQDSIPPLPDVTTVVQCIGFDRSSQDSLKDIYVVGLANVLAKLPPKGRLIYVSSTGVYGAAGGEEVDETTPANPGDEAGQVILMAEELLRGERPDAIVLRLAGIYGPGRLLREYAIRAGEPIATDPDRWLNLIHVEDAAAAVLAAEERGEPGETYNIADGTPVTRRDFFTRLAEVLGAPPPTFIAPRHGSERGDRRISVRKMAEQLGLRPQYPRFVEGLAASVETAPEPELGPDVPKLLE